MDSTRRARYPPPCATFTACASAPTRTPGRTDQDMIAGMRGDTFIAVDGVCSPSSPFRRPTRANEELASYIHATAVKRPSPAPPSARMKRDAALSRTAAFERAPSRAPTACWALVPFAPHSSGLRPGAALQAW